MLKITNANICDGKNTELFMGDILVENCKIKDIGRFNCECERVIDAKGLLATPGFVDTHRHFDFEVTENPSFGHTELAQGITTAICGNCGLAPYPCNIKIQEPQYSFLAPCLGTTVNDVIYDNVGDFLAEIAKEKRYLNTGALSATGAIKTSVKGFSNSPFTQKEMEIAQYLLSTAMQEGALGISCGLMYPPECYTTADEYVRLLSVSAKYDKILTSHIRCESTDLSAHVHEIIDIGKRANLRVNISHFKSVGVKNWHDEIYKSIEIIEKERALGYEVSVDFYPFLGGSTTLISLIPPTFTDKGTGDTLRRLELKSEVDLLEKEIYMVHKSWGNMVLDIGWDRIIISGLTLDKNKVYCGKSIASICEEYNFDTPVKFISELLVEEKGKVSIIVMSICQEDLDTIVSLNYSALISDALYGSADFPHPRLNASFSKLLREYVRDRKILTLPQAINKMTAMPADRFSMPQKGRIEIGADADINIFNLDDISDNANFSTPTLLSTGMKHVIIGGETVFSDETPILKNGIVIKS